MSDIETSQESVEAPAPKPSAPKQDDSKGELPEWARQQITAANQEAATFRVQLKEEKKQRQSLEEQVAALSTEKSSTAGSLSSVQSDFDKLVTAIKAEVPHESIFTFAKTLQGSTEDELSAHATELKKMFGPVGPSPAVDRSQGHGSSSKSSPADEFAKLFQSQLTR